MSGTVKVQPTEISRVSVRSEWLINRVGDIAVYSTVVIGYLYTLLSAHRLSLITFLGFTVVNLLYIVVAYFTYMRWRIVKGVDSRVAVGLAVLILLTFAAGSFLAYGLELDWLLYFSTVGICILLLHPRYGLPATLVLYLGLATTSILTLGVIGGRPYWLNTISGFAFIAAFSYSNRLLIAERERSNRLLSQLETSNAELGAAHKQLQRYAAEVEELAVAGERTRMAREIHDTLGHYLTILSIQLETIAKLQERDPAKAIAEVAEARRVAAQSMQEIRNAVAALRPTSIATVGLLEALRQLGHEFQQVAASTQLTLDLDTQLPLLSSDTQLALYRSAQEAFTNIRKHAHATRVLLRLRYEDDAIEMMVLNNGINSSTQVEAELILPGGGFGLLGLRERIDLLGGQVTYGPVGADEFRLSVRLPVKATAEEPVLVGSSWEEQ